MFGNWTEAGKALGPSQGLGAISNESVLLAAATILSLAVFLPASREGGALFFGSDKGKTAFKASLAMLLATMAATAFSTVASFLLLMVSILLMVGLGWKALRIKQENDQALEDSEQVIARARGRPSIATGQAEPPPAIERCTATKPDGTQCMNRSRSNGRCGRHRAV